MHDLVYIMPENIQGLFFRITGGYQAACMEKKNKKRT
jgi:hypothetical protein